MNRTVYWQLHQAGSVDVRRLSKIRAAIEEEQT